MITGGNGNDTIDGGDGNDVAILSGDRSSYTINTVEELQQLRLVVRKAQIR